VALTFAQAKQSRLLRIAGVCADSPEFSDLLNDGTRELLDRGNWWNTIKRFRGCIYNQCLTFPRQVGTVLAMNRCGRSIPPKNQWYDFDAVLPEHVRHWTQFGSFPCAHDLALTDHGTSPVFNQIPCGQNRFLQFYITQPSDVGKTITVFGVDGNGLEVLTTRSDGTIHPGEVVSLTIPFSQTATTYRRVDRIIKDKTAGPVYSYQWDSLNKFALATYAPSETLPEYRTSRIQSASCVTNCQQWPSQIEAFVKVEFIPVENDDDPVLVDCLDALSLAMQSVKLSEAYDSAGAEGMMARAVQRLNLQLRNKLPIDTIPVRTNPFGTADLRRRGIGTLM
jgi:hypothetical protein